MARLLARIVALNDEWARPFSEFSHRWTSALFRAITPIRDLLQGRWLGHPLRLRPTSQSGSCSARSSSTSSASPADVTLVATIIFMALSALAGLADYRDAGNGVDSGDAPRDVDDRRWSCSSSRRSCAGAPADRTCRSRSRSSFLVVSAGAFVEGDVAYVFGNMVSRQFRGPGTKWVRLETGDVSDLAQCRRRHSTKMRAGISDLVVVRIGDQVNALHAVCAHAGGPLPEV